MAPRFPLLLLAVLLAVLLAACASAPTPADEVSYGATTAVSYTVRAQPGMTLLSVEACFEGAPPQRLVPVRRKARELLVQAYAPDGRPLPIERGVIDTSELPPGACPRYTLDLAYSGWGRDFLRHRDDVLTSPNLLFFFPGGAGPDLGMRARFEVPGHVSAPWVAAEDPEGWHAFRPVDLQRAGNVAFTAEPPMSFEGPGVDVQVAVLEGALEVSREDLQQWLTTAVGAVSRIAGRFPRERLHLVVVPVSEGQAPIPFGLVRRGGGPSIMLLVAANATLDRLLPDWTAIHEMTHLAMPPMYTEDRWLSEGFATYYQEVLRVRAGLMDERTAWQRFSDRIGDAAEYGGGESLWETSEHFSDIPRIYWGGTAFMILVDVALRERGRSLDELVAETQHRWIGEVDRTWHGRDVFRAFDEALGEELLTPMVEAHGRRRAVPDVSEAFRRLGVVRDEAGQVTLDEHAPLAELRRAIMRGD